MSLRACFSIAVVAVAVLAFACGDDDSAPPLVCGPGTSAVLGECVIDGGMSNPMAGSGGGAAGSKPPAITCGAGTHEVKGECVANDAGVAPQRPLKGPIGAACEQASDCASGFCAIGATSPGGLCTVLGCDMDNPCPIGSTCYRVTKGTNICMPYCDTASECRTDDGYNCQPLYTNGVNICAPSCALTNACPSGTNCNATTGLCELAGCDPNAAQSACADTQTCFPDVRRLTAEGGLCLRLCDPKDPKKACKVDEKDEVCQPLPDDPANTGFCAPPVCSKTEECPPGALCQSSVCQPPALCDGSGACSDDSTTCVGGRCMPKCPTGTGESCSGIHSGLVCASVLAVPACLPLGTFPGSRCRDSRSDACSDLTVGSTTVGMSCVLDTCVVECGTTDVCATVSPSLACASGVFDQPLCLPKGSYPGGACDASNQCAQDLEGNPALDMRCLSGTCVIDCDEAGEWPGYGDALCALVDPSLTCANGAGGFCARACTAQGCAAGFSCFDQGRVPGHDNACLPTGTFPGSPCRTSGTACSDLALEGGGSTGQQCVNGSCVIRCNSAGNAAADDALCQGFDPALTCSESAGDLCVYACGAAGACATGYSCIDAGGENACLPTGSFPGSPCRPDSDDAGSDPDCDQNLGGVADADMVCRDSVCVVDCSTDGSETQDDALCAGVSSVLTCSESAGDLCVLACGAAPGFACPSGYSCLQNDGENACLPTGSFPSSPCLPDDNDADTDGECGPFSGTAMKCVDEQCLIDCSTGGDTLCATVGLTCSESAGSLCVYPCDETDGSCPPGFSCLESGVAGPENACLPEGSFPGSSCRPTVGDECDLVDDTFPMICVADTCTIDCSLGPTPELKDSICEGIGAGLGASLTCFEGPEVEICVPACDAGDCPAGFSCFDPGNGHQNSCLPDGSFLGSACAQPGNTCGAFDVAVGPDLAMSCIRGVCGIACIGENDGDRDTYCGTTITTAVGTDMTCSETAGNQCVVECGIGASCPDTFSCFDDGGEDACLPNGTFPGSECREVGTKCDPLPAGLGGTAMECTAANRCAVSCDNAAPGGNDALCMQLGVATGTTLTCSESASEVCVPACSSGTCGTGLSCLDPAGENACLPNGSFPGSACAAGDTCFPVPSGATAATQTCISDVCVPQCPNDNDALCGGIDASLTCSLSAGNLCVPKCGNGGSCDAGFSCLLPGSTTENECLPTGSFPTSPCRAQGALNGRCDENFKGIEAADLACSDPPGTTPESCNLPCATDNDALCGQADARLTCFQALQLCVIKCQGPNQDQCPPGFVCNTDFLQQDGKLCLPPT